MTAADLLKGDLAEGVLPRLMHGLYVGRKTGMLHLRRGAERRSVRFHRGHILNADTTVPEDHMGEVLVRRGVVTRAELERAEALMSLEQKRMGQVFLELGVLDQGRLEDAVAMHVHEILLKVFGWNEGTYEFAEEADRPEEEEFALKLSTGEIILEAVRQIQDPDVIRYNLGDLDRLLALPADPLLRFQRITLSPSDGFVLSRVDGTLTAREVMQMIPLPREEAERSLFSLLCVGAIEYGPVPHKAPSRPAPARPAPPPVAAPLPIAVEAPPPAPLPEAAPPASSETVARRQEILEAHEGLKTRNHFELLGITRAANEAQVKEAYFRLAKRFHPDAHHDAALVDLRDRLEAVFIRLGEAYEVLRHPRTRGSYEEMLASKMPRVVASPGPDPTPGPATPADPEAERKAAVEAVLRAEKALLEEKYWDAIQILDPALQHLQGKLLQRGRLALAKARLKNPKWLKQAEETLQRIVHDDPQHVEALFLLGTIYRDSGLRSRAQSMFRKVLELKPDHEEALAQVDSPAPEPEKGGGLIKKLFRR